ncbi:MAG: tyrosine-type recombinase/integrase [Terriglobia bacterium]|nr:tyrosine-type recombinase/integrase [Terriglobia bacterium]
MLLSVFTRHSTTCRFSRDRACRRCNCPKWVGGQVNGYYFRQSAKTRQWAEAEDVRVKLEEALINGLPPFGTAVAAGSAPPIPTPADPPPASRTEVPEPRVPKPRPRVTVAQAVEAYLADAVSRSVETSTLKKLETIFRKQFLVWTRIEGIEYLDELELDTLLNFRNTWEDGPLAKQKKQSRVIGFFWACVRRRYLTENPAIGLGKIKVVQIPTDYFPPDEFERIIAATYIRRGDRGGGDVKANQTRLRTMTLLMRWSGLRIRDAVTLERHRLNGDSLLLYQAKTGTPVYVPLPPQVVEALEDIPPGPKPNPRYFFWSGNGDPKSAVADWQRSYRRLFKSADIRTADGERKRCHPHMFRDTFAVEMLLAGVPIDQVSLLLGHASVKITEKSYAPFVKARQIQLQASVRNAWNVGTPTGKGPESPPTVSSRPVNRTGWQLIHSDRKSKATA